MRIKILLDIEMGDIPEPDRKDIEDMIGQTPPKLSDYNPEEVAEELCSMFSYIDNYDVQQDLWAGSDFYGMIKKVHSAEVLK